MSRRKDGSYRYDGRWRSVRQHVLERDGGVCQLRLDGCLTTASEVDHIADVTMGGAVLEPDNCRAVCGPCHRRHTSREAGTDSSVAPSTSVAEGGVR